MAKYSMKDRKNMSMGARDYDKGYAKGKNERYMKGMSGMNKKVMGHDGKVERIETCEAEKYDMGRVQMRPYTSRGYDKQAFDYSW